MPGGYDEYDSGYEYYGSVWACYGDAIEIEIEEWLDEFEVLQRRSKATHWMPLPEPPKEDV